MTSYTYDTERRIGFLGASITASGHWPELIVNHFHDAEGFNAAAGGNNLDKVKSKQVPLMQAFNPHLVYCWFGISALKPNLTHHEAYAKAAEILEELRHKTRGNPLVKVVVLTQPPSSRKEGSTTAAPRTFQNWNEKLVQNDAGFNRVVQLHNNPILYQAGIGRKDDGVHFRHIGDHYVAERSIQETWDLLQRR